MFDESFDMSALKVGFRKNHLIDCFEGKINFSGIKEKSIFPILLDAMERLADNFPLQDFRTSDSAFFFTLPQGQTPHDFIDSLMAELSEDENVEVKSSGPIQEGSNKEKMLEMLSGLMGEDHEKMMKEAEKAFESMELIKFLRSWSDKLIKAQQEGGDFNINDFKSGAYYHLTNGELEPHVVALSQAPVKELLDSAVEGYKRQQKFRNYFEAFQTCINHCDDLEAVVKAEEGIEFLKDLVKDKINFIYDEKRDQELQKNLDKFFANVQ
jgi:hypothetical protein